MAKKVMVKMELDCDKCKFYRYIRCLGYDCFHPDAPEPPEGCNFCGDDCQLDCVRKEEPLAENREGDIPKWCPILTRSQKGN